MQKQKHFKLLERVCNKVMDFQDWWKWLNYMYMLSSMFKSYSWVLFSSHILDFHYRNWEWISLYLPKIKDTTVPAMLLVQLQQWKWKSNTGC